MRRLPLLLPLLLLFHGVAAQASLLPVVSSPLTRPLAAAEDASSWLARSGGGHSRSRSHHGGGQRARTGLGQRPSSFDRGSRRPRGGWSQGLGDGGSARRGLNRDLAGRHRIEGRRESFDRDQLRSRFRDIDRDRIRDLSRDFDRRDWDRARDRWRDQGRRWERQWDRASDRWADDWPGWVRPGWGLARPWRWGWYGTSAIPAWGWWGTRSALWGIGTLATAAIINAAVNEAIVAQQTTIVVPESDWTLAFDTLQPSADAQLQFNASRDGRSLTMTADCRRGDLNGAPPTTAAEAQLLNAACQVAFGTAEVSGDTTAGEGS